MDIRIQGHIMEGKLKLHPGQQERLRALAPLFEGKDVEVIVRLPSEPSSEQHRNFYRFTVIPLVRLGLVDVLGHEPAAVPEKVVDEYLQREFLRRHWWSSERGRWVSYSPSLAELSTKELTQFILSVLSWAALDLGMDFDLEAMKKNI